MSSIVLIRSGPFAQADDMLIPPLGLLYLASTIRQHGYSPHLVDLKVDRLSEEDLCARVREFRADAIGISAFTPDAAAMHETVNRLRLEFPTTPIVVGGPHASADPADVVANPSVTCAVLGEGEATFVDLLSALGAGRSLKDVEGIAIADENRGVWRTATRQPIRDLDALPFPAWDLIDFDRYSAFHGATPVGRRRYMSIFTSRACPYQCTYCHTIFGKEFRVRSPENVVAEMKELRDRYGIRVIEVSDDIFNLKWQRAHQVCERIAEANLGLSLSFPNGLRADIMRPELIDSMRRAGTYFISYAIESGSPRIQQLVKKRLNLDRTRETIERTVDSGIYTNGFFMMGFPTETREEVEMTIRYACESRLHSASFFLLCPFRGTEIYESIKEASLEDLRAGSTLPVDYHSGSVNCSGMTTSELLASKRSAYMRFYFGKGRLLRTLAAHPDKAALPGLAWKVLRRMELRPSALRSPAQDMVAVRSEPIVSVN